MPSPFTSAIGINTEPYLYSATLKILTHQSAAQALRVQMFRQKAYLCVLGL